MIEERLEFAPPLDCLFGTLRERPGAIWLDSGLQQYGLGRYSMVVVDPIKEIVVRGDEIEVLEKGGRRVESGDPIEALRREAKIDSSPRDTVKRPPFSGGAVGYVSYDFGRRLKPTTLSRRNESLVPEARFGVYDAALVWDHENGELFARVSDRSFEPEKALERMKEIVAHAIQPTSRYEFSVGKIESNFTREFYFDRVERARCYIRDGEIYQANISQRFSAPFEGSAFELYRRLRESNPAPYAAYMNFGDEQILSSSPERFIWHENGVVNTRPIKGTRPRGVDDAENRAYRAELEQSEKDRAELLMIVDLERNDLGRVCQPGSIEVSDLYGLENYASVMHQTATVKGVLRSDRDALDCFESMFPGGSITGAPKIRAMEIIDELESGDRGVYTGSIGYIGFDGTADFNIAIRTMRIADSELSFSVGGGVVWDSNPKSEYEETLHKARAMFDALGRKRDE